MASDKKRFLLLGATPEFVPAIANGLLKALPGTWQETTESSCTRCLHTLCAPSLEHNVPGGLPQGRGNSYTNCASYDGERQDSARQGWLLPARPVSAYCGLTDSTH